MNILFCGDQNVEKGLIIGCISLLKQVTEELNIYVLTIDMEYNGNHIKPITDICVEELDHLVKEKNQASFVKKIDITYLFEKEIPTLNMKTLFTPCCMLRLFADEIKEMPSRILYLDTDIIARKDFKEFYYQDMENVEFSGVLDYIGRWFFRKKFFINWWYWY